MRTAAILLALLAAARTAPGADVGPALAEADRLWTLRGEGSTGGTALAAPVDRVLAACREALSADPESLDARWRLMRALYFKGEYVAGAKDEKQRLFGEGRALAEETLPILRRRAAGAAGRSLEKASPVELVPYVKAIPAAAPFFLWAAADWGKWALVYGKMAAVREGAAARIRDYAQALVLVDPAYEDAAGYRILGRLHHQTPFVPLLTGWASRKEAIRNLRKAVEISPRHFLNREYLAEVLWDYQPQHRDEARGILQALVADTPMPEALVEERRVQEEAAATLKAWSR